MTNVDSSRPSRRIPPVTSIKTLSRRSLLRSGLAMLLGMAATMSFAPGASARDDDAGGAVFALTNANSPAGNAVVMYRRASNGTLTPGGTYATGGTGTGAGLGSQDAVIVSRDKRFLFAVNAGSDSITSFRIRDAALELVDVQHSGGDQPTSLTLRHGLLYVLNAGVPNNITGFKVSADGRLRPIPNSTRSLSGSSVAPAQVGFSQDGDSLIVTERGTNLISTFNVGDDGVAEGPIVNPSAGPVPFGFAAGRRNTILVSEAGTGGGASTYKVDDGNLQRISAMVMTGQRAACWALITNNGRFGYVTNAGTGNISGFALARDGSATLLNANGITTVTGGNPTDMAMSEDGRYLYARVGALSQIAIFRIRDNGSLTALPALPGVPGTLAGLAGF